MLFFVVLSVVTCLLPVTCQTDQQCGLEVTNKKSFEENILDYIREDSTFVLIEYNLTMSSNGSIINWNNITDSKSIEPWRWYRAKSRSIIRLIFLYNLFRPTKILFYPTVNAISVNVIDKPDGCLRNIDINNMTSFIMNIIIEDFLIPFDDLRTTSKVYKDADVCTLRKDEQTDDIYLWCCRHNLHNEIDCADFPRNYIYFVLIQVFVSIVLWISYLYSPYLLHVDTVKRETQKRVSENVVGMENERTCKLQMSFYYQQKQPLPFGLIHFIKTNSCSCLTKKEYSSKRSCCCETENFGSACYKFFFIFVIFLVFFFFPTILIITLYGNSSYLGTIIVIFGSLILILVTFCFIGKVLVDDCIIDDISKSFYKFPDEIKSNWKVQSTCDKVLWIFNFFLKSPIVTIIYSLEKCDNVNTNDSMCKKGCKCCCSKVFPLIILIFTLPTVVLSNLFVIFVAVFMYQAPYMYPILSGVAAFQLYMRDASKTIRSKYERCLKFVIEKIKEHSLTTHSVEDETLLHFYKGKSSSFNYNKVEDVLYVEGCIPFIIEDSKIYVKETVLSHFMKYRIEKVIVFVATATTFMISVVLLVVFIGRLEYISSSNQMFIAFIAGVIPLLIKIGYNGASNDSDIYLDKEEFEKNLISYKEQFDLGYCYINNSQQQADSQDTDSNLQEVFIVSDNENLHLIALDKNYRTRYEACEEEA